MLYVYIAGPYTAPNPVINARNACLAGDRVRDAGHAPFVPHLNLLWDFVSPATYDEWLQLDFKWLRKCDALIRLPGESPGSDREVALARGLGIPVYYGVREFLSFNPEV